MTTEQLELQVEATSDANGAATFTFASVPQNLAWRGNLRIQGAPFNSTHSVVVGSGTGAGDDWGEWQGPLFYGPVQAISNRTLQILSTGLIPGKVYYATWLGISANVDELPPAQPAPAPAQSQGFTAGTFIADKTLTGPGVHTLGPFPCSNVKGARYSMTNNAPTPIEGALQWREGSTGALLASRLFVLPASGGYAQFTTAHRGDTVTITFSGTLTPGLEITAAHVDSDRESWSGIIAQNDALEFMPGFLIATATSVPASTTRVIGNTILPLYAGPATAFVHVNATTAFVVQLQAQDSTGAWSNVAEWDNTAGVDQISAITIPAMPLRVQAINQDGAAAHIFTVSIVADEWR